MLILNVGFSATQQAASFRVVRVQQTFHGHQRGHWRKQQVGQITDRWRVLCKMVLYTWLSDSDRDADVPQFDSHAQPEGCIPQSQLLRLHQPSLAHTNPLSTPAAQLEQSGAGLVTVSAYTNIHVNALQARTQPTHMCCWTQTTSWSHCPSHRQTMTGSSSTTSSPSSTASTTTSTTGTC